MRDRDELRRHLAGLHDEDDASLNEMMAEMRSGEATGDPNPFAAESDEGLLEAIHERQHTTLDWNPGHDEADMSGIRRSLP